MTVQDQSPNGRFQGLMPQRTVLSDDVYEALKAIMMDHVIAPGERIGIERLATELNVSPTPIREALARLEAEHLVVKEPLKGYRSTTLLTRDETNELFELRMLIEPWAAAKAAELISPERSKLLLAEIDDATDAPDGIRYDNYRLLADHDKRFHELIANAAQNQRIVEVFEGMHVHLHLFRLYYGGELGLSALEEHRVIGSTILDGDPRAAEAAMQSHLETSWARLLPVFDATGEVQRKKSDDD